MGKTISAYEAPALLDEHPTLTRLSLYEQLSGAARAIPSAGLSSHIADGVISFAADENGWGQPVRRDFRKTVIEGADLDAHARAWRMKDDDGEFVAVFTHLATFMHSQAWAKPGVPPRAFVVQANWTMLASDAKRAAIIVLADKRMVIYWVERDEAVVDALKAGLADMAKRLAAGDPPPIDAVPQVAEIVSKAKDGEATAADMDELCGRWRATQVAKATAANAVQTAEHAFEAAAGALKAALKPGAHHDHEGFRIHHNAKTGRLTEEKIDGAYF